MNNTMKKQVYYIVAAMFLVACNGKGGKINEPSSGGHGIGIDTETVHKIQQYEDSIKAKEPEKESPKPISPSSSSSSKRSYEESDNMRGFDPASEDDMDDNGMSRYMENTDDEGWD